MVIETKKNSHILFVCLIALLVVLAFARYAFTIEIPRMLLTLIVLFIALVGNRNEVLAITLCCIPLHEAIDFYIAVVLCTVIWFAKSYKSIRIGFPVILCIVLVCWELLHFFIAGFDLRLMITSLIPFIFLAAILSTDVLDIDYAFVIRTVAVMAIAVNFMLFFNCVKNAGYDFSIAILNLQRLGMVDEDATLIGGMLNPNALGIVNVLISTAIFQLRSINQIKKIDYITVILLITFGALTSSRTFLVCLLVMAFLLIFGHKGSIRKKIRIFVVLTLAAMVVWFIMSLVFPTVLEYYIGRFQIDSLEDFTTGRSGLMEDYSKFIFSNSEVMFFGVGLSNFGDKLLNIRRVSWNIPHNGIQEIIVVWGIPGLFIIGLLIFVMVWESKRYNFRKSLLNYIPLAIILIKSLAGQFVSSGYTILALAFAYLSLCQNFSVIEKSESLDELSL